MRLSRIHLVLAGAAAVGLACTGQIQTGSGSKSGGNGPNGPTGPTGPMGPDDKPPPTDPPPVEVGTCNATTLGKPRVWRLTHTQLKNTLTDNLGYYPPTIDMFPGETRLEGFANQSSRLTVAPLLADYYLRASDELAGNVLGRMGEFLKCPMTGLAPGTCLNDFIKSMGMKMWRRPLTDTEVGKLSGLYTATVPTAGGPEAGVKNIVQAMFMSPQFLYRTELGNTSQAGAVTYLTDYELASALSYMLWDSSPDKTLYDLAAAGKLHDKDTLLEQAQRLWTSKKSQNALNGFLQQWLQIEELLGADKDATNFPKYSKTVAADLQEEVRLFLNSVVFDQGGDRSFKTLFTADYGFVNAGTAAAVYGIPSTSQALTRTTLPANQRRGLLTLGAFLSAHADGDDTGLVSRGRYFREEILCNSVPPPDPAKAVFDPQKIRPDMTNRERLEAHTTNPACFACHQLFDGLGFAMENYDPVGAYRTMDKGKMIDPTGSIPLPSGPTIEFKNFIDLIDQLAKSPDLYSCFSSQYLSYATGRAADSINPCERKLVTDEFVKSDYKIDTLVMSVVKSPSFMARKN